METCINYVDSDTAYVSSDERKWCNKVRKLAESHPEQVRIIKKPEENGGCVYATVPAGWVRIQPPKTRNLTDEQKNELAERLRFARNSHY